MKTKIVKLKETTSTNDFLRTEGHNYKADIVVATADYQSAGRGQGTNTWESEAGKNLLFSVDRKSTRLNSSHANISYAVFCLKKKKTIIKSPSVSPSPSLPIANDFRPTRLSAKPIPTSARTSSIRTHNKHD